MKAHWLYGSGRGTKGRSRLSRSALVAALGAGLLLVALPTTAGATGTWSLVTSANKGADGDGINTVACHTSSSCEAVGAYFTGSHVKRTLAESWNGTSWATQSTPNNGAGDNDLVGVACVTSTSCKAVGYFVNGSSVDRTLAESWNGTAWTIIPIADNGVNTNYLYDVSCVSSTNCKAVGYYVNASSVQKTLIESWNGSTWSLMTSPNSGTGTNYLRRVSCFSASSCKAVGDYQSGTITKTLVESWNGSTWSVTSSPNIGAGSNILFGVSCFAATSCKAVGNYDNASNLERTLAESWNGTSWTVVSSPNEGTGVDFLNNLSCTSSSSCQAVGSYVNGSSVNQTLAEGWNGTSWSVESTPDASANTNYLFNVTCNGALCKAVGDYLNGSSIPQTLVESHS